MATDGRRWLAAFALLACASTPTPRVGMRSIDVALPNIEGAIVEIGAERPDDVILMVFWATWCQPCQQELAKLGALEQARRDRGLRTYAIAIDGPDTAAQVGPWAKREGYRFAVLLDRETRTLARYNPRGDIPYYVVVDGTGKVLRDHQGYVTGDLEELASFLDDVLRPG